LVAENFLKKGDYMGTLTTQGICQDCGNDARGGICNLCTSQRLIVELECLLTAVKNQEIGYFDYMIAREDRKSTILKLIETHRSV
jgi:hypothetical protein